MDYDISFGVLPYPMWDEKQKDVGYRSLQWGGYLCIPSYTRNLNMIGDTIERLFQNVSTYNVGAAMSLVMMILILISLTIMNKFSDEEGGMVP